MRFILELQCDNLAFGETNAERGQELARILRSAASYLEADGCGEGDSRRLMDGFGNSVGFYEVTDG